MSDMNIHTRVNKYLEKIMIALTEYCETLKTSRDTAANDRDWCYAQGQINGIFDAMCIVHGIFKKEDE